MPRRVLVVDDDAMVAGFMFDVLEGLGHRAQEANSGQEALDVLREDDGIDLVITDLNMPEMSGHELTGRIKENWPGLQVALVTANCAASGDDPVLNVLRKPYTREELRSMLRQLDAEQVLVSH